MITLEALLFPFGKSSYKFNESHRVRKTEGFMEELDGDKNLDVTLLMEGWVFMVSPLIFFPAIIISIP